MFGYIKPYTPDLRVKEYELYRAVYCGLCHSLGKEVTCTSKLSLSYDFVFLALVRMALVGETGEIIKKRCVAHPTKKKSMVFNSGELDVSARLSAVLTYHKIRDDIADSHGIKKLMCLLLLPSASRMRKKAKISDECEEFISGQLSELSNLEADGCGSVDRAAEPFGELMAKVFAYGFDENGRNGRIAAEIGRYIGKFIYMLDAIDDFDKDIKTNSYNPFRKTYGSIEEFSKDIALMKNALTLTLKGAADAMELIDFSHTPEYGEIIKNTLYLGLPKLCDKILSKYTDKNDTMEKMRDE